VLLVAATLVVRGLDLKALLASGLDLIRGAGPVVFFGSMAVLPSFGAPLSPFALTAGSVFAPTLGMPLVIVLALTAVTFNIMLSYYLAGTKKGSGLVYCNSQDTRPDPFCYLDQVYGNDPDMGYTLSKDIGYTFRLVFVVDLARGFRSGGTT